jgi:MYXO-CTERM domain-containing protein
VRANFDARLVTPLDQSNMIDGALVESLGIVGEAPLVKGSLMQSVMYHNANSANESFSMPPLAKTLIDKYGMAVFAAWIEALGTGNENKPSPVGCEGPDAGGAAGAGVGGAAGAAGADDAGEQPPPDGQSGGGPMMPMTGGSAGRPVTDDAGCSCRVGQGGAKPIWLGWLLLSAPLVVRRRRRSRA